MLLQARNQVGLVAGLGQTLFGEELLELWHLERRVLGHGGNVWLIEGMAFARAARWAIASLAVEIRATGETATVWMKALRLR